jgi:hypothetical protein
MKEKSNPNHTASDPKATWDKMTKILADVVATPPSIKFKEVKPKKQQPQTQEDPLQEIPKSSEST